MPSGSQAETPRRILVVDDDEQLARGLALALGKQGYIVETVGDGAEVPRFAKEFAPDLVILDVMMPRVDGWTVLRWLRDEPATARIAVIMLTASAAEEAKVKGFGLGADDYVTKPFSLKELLCRVEAVARRVEASNDDEAQTTVPAVSGSGGHMLIKVSDIFYVEGVRNYTYLHTFEDRHLCQLSLGALDARHADGLLRVHRSYLVNMRHVVGAGWKGHSSFRLTLDDATTTEVPVSRSLIADIQKQLGLKR